MWSLPPREGRRRLSRFAEDDQQQSGRHDDDRQERGGGIAVRVAAATLLWILRGTTVSFGSSLRHYFPSGRKPMGQRTWGEVLARYSRLTAS
jgi:hypothetical protein